VLDRIEIREVRDVADQLDDCERALIRAHYGLGLTAERARQIELGALHKLREALARARTGCRAG
jgi:RNA polymerase primary sigma factor